MPDDRDYADRLVDEEALASYLASELGPVDEYAVEWHREGHSNETIFVDWGDRRLVLRRPPAGGTADTAHDVAREYRVMDALQAAEVPVPGTVTLCEDHSVLGCDFSVVEHVPGDVLRLEEPTRFAAPEQRRELGHELVDTLAALHAVDYEAIGLGDLGRPQGYNERQVDRWKSQLAWAADRTDRAGGLPHRAEVEWWLADNTPPEADHGLVHGDYKLDNVIVAPGTPPRIAAVVDWELSTLGDPLVDLGWMLLFWHDDPDEPPPVAELLPSFTAREGYPTRRALAERYEARTGRAFDDRRFYLAFAAYKIAGACEMFYARHLAGDGDDPLYAAMDEGTPAMLALAHEIVDGELVW